MACVATENKGTRKSLDSAAPFIDALPCFQPGGDYFVARYTAVRVNRQLPPSTFQIPGAKNAKRVKMN
jgi:hypothetical protein